jgi:hypothetical protein
MPVSSPKKVTIPSSRETTIETNMKKIIICGVATAMVVAISYAATKCVHCNGTGWNGQHNCAICKGTGRLPGR